MTSKTPPANASELRTRASQLIRDNRLEEAQAALESLIREVPQDVPACLQLADLMYQRGQIRASSGPLLKACQHLPRHVPVLLHLINQLIFRGEVVAARACMDFLEQAPEPPPELSIALAHLRFSQGEIDAAKRLVEAAIHAGADDPSDHHMHAMLLQFTGDIDSACDVLESCLRRWPMFGDAIVPLVGMQKQRPDNNRLQFIEEQLQQLPDPAQDKTSKFIRAEFEYARFRVLDSLKRHEEAWPSLQRSNALMHEINPYDARDEDALIDAFVHQEDLVATDPVDARGFDGPTPIFIVGLPRSGTTLLDRMLSSHSEVVSAGELVEFWRQLNWVAEEKPAQSRSLRRVIKKNADIDLREVGARYLEQTQWRAREHNYYIDKLPANIQMVAFIRRALPHAPILHMVRDPMDVCFSNYKAFFGNDSSTFSYDLQVLAHYFRGYRRLCEHWRTRLPGAMLDVPYTDLVGKTSEVMHSVLKHCGLSIEDACLHPENNTSPVATPSSAQVREPIHTRSLGEWQNYASQLEPLYKAIS